MTPPRNSDQVKGHDIAPHLQPVLTTLVALALNGKQAHWHVRGRHFLPVHEQLDTVVSDARSYADEVAERLVALGVAVDGRAHSVAEATGVFPEGFLADDKVIALIIEQLDAVIERARAGLEALDDIDLVSQDLLIALVQAMEKHRWMFEAQRDSN